MTPTSPGAGASGEYAARYAERSERAARLAAIERSISRWRLGVFLAGVGIAWLALGLHLFAPGWLAVPLAGFAALVLAHARVIPERKRAERAAAFYDRGLARLEDRWSGGGETGLRFLDLSHPYAHDLDLFGNGSLFQLLCTARTRAGEETLAAWLLDAAPPGEIRARQEAVAELSPRLDLREQIALLGADVGAGVHPEALAKWGNAPPVLFAPRWRIAAALLAALTLAAAVAWQITDIGPLPLLLLLLVEGGFGLALRARVSRIVRDVELPGRDLQLLSDLLARIEVEPLGCRMLARLRADLDTAGVAPSRRIAQLERLIHLLDARRNQFFAPLAPLLLWTTQLAFAIERWRLASGPALGRWLAVVGEFEALCALASHSYEHPDDPFPEIVEEGPLFEGRELGHPLIPSARCVRNDVRLGRELAVLVVSGSNMSGKSTLLRTVGTNAILALSGAPARAGALAISPLAIGTSMRVQDSLQEGTSRFYAEITRLRMLTDRAGGRAPLLFLLDEILHGTNSHDRRIGAEAVVRNLVDQGSIGFVTTHDLTLTHIADALAPRAANVHFADHLEGGKMTFDYRMHPGVVRKSNALELMRAVGLKV